MSDKNSRVAIVTGASRGIGAAVAARLAKDGFAVVIDYAGSAAAAEALARSIEHAGGRARAIQADVSDAGAVRRMFDETEAAFGGVDVVVNNAGVMTLAPIAESDDAMFEQQVAINLRGTFNVLREAPVMIATLLFLSDMVVLLETHHEPSHPPDNQLCSGITIRYSRTIEWTASRRCECSRGWSSAAASRARRRISACLARR